MPIRINWDMMVSSTGQSALQYSLRTAASRPHHQFSTKINTPARVQLVLGIGNKETQYRYLRQIGGGPALGPWQMEPATHDDMWRNFIRYRPELQSAALRLLAGAAPDARLLTTRMDYSALMAALHVYRSKDALPAYGNAYAQATFWKDNFNTSLGKGAVAGALPYFQQAVKV